MIQFNNLLLDTHENGCSLPDESIESINHTNDILKESIVEHTKAEYKEENFEKIIITPSIDLVNGIDLASSARVMKAQYNKIKTAQAEGAFIEMNTWHSLGRTAGINL